MTSGVRIWIGLGLAAVAASGCSHAKLPPEPDSYVAAAQADPAQVAALAASPAASWLDDMNSIEMSALTREALLGSPELQIAEARARAARWRARGAAGGWLPSVSAAVFGSREETPAGGGQRIRSEIMTSQVSASWELDLWGRVGAGVMASDLSADAAEEDFNDARLSVSGQVARAWVSLIEAQQLVALANEDTETQERALDLTQRRYERGIATSLALRTARSQVASTRALKAQAQDNLLIASRHLQELMGRYPDGRMLAQGQLPSLSSIAAAGAPADLLERRPDVRAAEARLRAAGFRIHEARTALLPRLTLTATAGNSGQGLTDIDDSVNMISNIVGGITQPIFNGGALFSESRASVADRRAAAAFYVQTVLVAWREVEAAISADQSLEIREREFGTAAEEARAAQDLAEREYGRGVATIFELMDAYTRRINAERGLIGARADRITNRINYHVALGGGAATGGLALRGHAEAEATP